MTCGAPCDIHFASRCDEKVVDIHKLLHAPACLIGREGVLDDDGVTGARLVGYFTSLVDADAEGEFRTHRGALAGVCTGWRYTSITTAARRRQALEVDGCRIAGEVERTEHELPADDTFGGCSCITSSRRGCRELERLRHDSRGRRRRIRGPSIRELRNGESP